MTASAHLRGIQVFYIDNEWRYADGAIAELRKPCARCKQPPTPEGYDACLGYMSGAISACCGHGVEAPYIVYEKEML